MGTLYAAKHVRLKNLVALKVLRGSHVGTPESVGRFHREMEAIGKLNHPNIVRALDAGEEEGVNYLVMEMVQGLDLKRLVSRLGPLSISDRPPTDGSASTSASA